MTLALAMSVPPLRQEVDLLMSAEATTRAARRRWIEHRPPTAEDASIAEAAIEAAIADLVAARHLIRNVIAADAAPSKDL